MVIPSLGRPSLHELLSSLAVQAGPRPAEVVIVDDRRVAEPAIDLAPEVVKQLCVRVFHGMGRGPAAGRNLGWRLVRTPWVAFLDDDVWLPPDWSQLLAADLAGAGDRVAGVQGRLHVPLPRDRWPTDWERGTAGLQDAAWPTADLAYRRAALLAVDGFDERFPRAYREDADLALRMQRAGWSLQRGERTTVHPVRPVDDAVSVRVQRGNADDALMRRLHGRSWRRDAGTGRGRLPWHVTTVLCAGTAAALLARGLLQRGPIGTPLSRAGVVGAAAWLALTAEFAGRRILPGPRDRAEVWRMLWTSVAIPPVAVAHRLRGEWRQRRAAPWPPSVEAVLFDRDGTLVRDVPYNGDPALVVPVDGAKEALDRLRNNGIKVGVITNQSGVGRGVISGAQMQAVNAQIDALLGPFDTWQVCPHAPEDGCACRKPAPAMVLAAAEALGVHPGRCAVVGDIATDLGTARASGARGILVPNDVTRAEEVADAPVVASDLAGAVDLLLANRPSLQDRPSLEDRRG